MNYRITSSYSVAKSVAPKSISLVTEPKTQSEKDAFKAAQNNMIGIFGSIADPNGKLKDNYGFPIRLKAAQEVVSQLTNNYKIDSKGGEIKFSEIQRFFQPSADNPRERVEVWMLVIALSEREGAKFKNVQLTNNGIKYKP